MVNRLVDSVKKYGMEITIDKSREYLGAMYIKVGNKTLN